MNEELIITVPTDNGESLECNVITTFAMENQNYVALFPRTQNASEILLFKYVEISDDEAISISMIEDDLEFEKAMTIFDGLMSP